MKEEIKINENLQVCIKQNSKPDYVNNKSPEEMKQIIKKIAAKKKEKEALKNGK